MYRAIFMTADLLVLDGNCVEACPTGYTVDDSLRTCVSCNGGLCPKGSNFMSGVNKCERSFAVA